MSNTARGQYREVADRIRDSIDQGVYQRGELLPTEDQLADRLGVHRATVNKALKVLLAEGLVRVHRGKGTYVTEIPVIHRAAVGRQRRETREAGQARGAFDAELRALGLTPRSDVTPERTSAAAEVAEKLEIDEGADVLARRRTMFANDVPVQLAVSYIPWSIAEGTPLTEADPGPGGAYSRLEELGHAPAVFTETLRVRPPDAHEADKLKLSPDQRVIAVTRVARTSAGQAVEVNNIVLPAHQWELSYEWPAD
ncbi:GntR family transcriptional regulator [Actinomadura coerulea]|uniref:GntR family transcriptional regulator n=1 Tax=Actinomadura coerulea TaxID=46159 RepID=UPI0034144ACB